MTGPRRTMLLAAALTAGLLAGPVGSASAAGPRPGCGYGDTNHNHQAAPGLDPRGLRPGKGIGDTNHPHTVPPGQAPDGGGEAGDPMRGCKAERPTRP